MVDMGVKLSLWNIILYFPLFLYVFACVYMYTCVPWDVHMCTMGCIQGQETTDLSFHYVGPGIELRSLGVVAGTFVC